MKPDITEYARTMTTRDRLRTAWLSFLYGMGPKVAKLFYTTYIGG